MLYVCNGIPLNAYHRKAERQKTDTLKEMGEMRRGVEKEGVRKKWEG